MVLLVSTACLAALVVFREASAGVGGSAGLPALVGGGKSWRGIRRQLSGAGGPADPDAEYPIDIVLTYFREDKGFMRRMIERITNVTEFRKLGKPRVWVYLKDPTGDPAAVKAAIPHVHKVVKIANLGKEAYGYLWHVIHERDHLAAHTIFLQYEDYERVLVRMERLFQLETGAMGFVVRHTSCLVGGDWGGTMVGVRDMYNMMSDTPCHLLGGVFTEFERAQMVISRRRLLSRSTRFYKALLSQFTPNMHWGFYKDIEYLDNGSYHHWLQRQSPIDSFSAHVMERSWAALWRCWDPSVANNCRCVRYSDECTPGMCQCVDNLETGEMHTAYRKEP